ncbi:hypothetical protein J27TS7_10970 [Paenibacillus dendritiformis]|uniref:hypothetical protein n=1 Tax=Paenibacillus dendritiformis TaxID=130049 RepID=UPI001B012AF0|nr:hypothetical protein [Paenibacillus dendritiformis]GIO71583.1 hypothetical protein J27TS7_10970 [Paenibacillus dendritiformis]
MRNAIRERLIAAIPELKDVYEPHAAEAKSEKPYVVVLQGQDSDESPWTGFRRIVEVWPYVSRSTFEKVDALAGKIIAALDKQLLTTEAGEVFSCIYLGSSGQDVVDEEWDAITRGMQFAVMALQPVGTDGQITSDPWVPALASWTTNIMGQDWAVYNGFWPLGYARPAVMWRVTGIDVTPISLGLYRITKRFTVHVAGNKEHPENAGVAALVERLGSEIKIPFDLKDRRYLTIMDPKANIGADALQEGQITVTLSRRVSRPQADVPLIRSVNYKSSIR